MRKLIANFAPVSDRGSHGPYIDISTDEEDGLVFVSMRDMVGRLVVLPLRAEDFAMILREATMAWAKMLRTQQQASRDTLAPAELT